MSLRLEIARYGDARDYSTFDRVVAELAAHLQIPVELQVPLSVDLEKAVPVHAGHYRPRSASGAFQPVAAPTNRHTLRDLRGQFTRRLTEDEQTAATQEAAALINEQLSPRLHRWLGLYNKHAMSTDEWVDACMQDLWYFYDAIYRSGKQSAGDPAVKLTPTDRAIINRMVRDEGDYLRRFAKDMEAGRTPAALSYPARLEMYAQAAWESFWTGWLMGDLRASREIRWRFGPTEEHCHDCQRFVDMGWLGVDQFYTRILSKGFTPRAGQLECIGLHCRCWLQERFNGTVSGDFRYPEGKV